MPHDKNGHLVEIGAVVKVEGRVKFINQSENYCNLTVELPPLNATQVEVVERKEGGI